MTTYENILDLTLWSWDDQAETEISEHLDFIADIDLDEPCHNFNLLRLYVRRRDGMLLWATDSGCSCPAPFESTKVKDLRESTLTTIEDAVIEETQDVQRYSSRPWALIRRDLRAALDTARERGAR